MGNLMDSGMDSLSGEVDPGKIISDCKEKIDQNNKEIDNLELQLAEFEVRIEKICSEDKDPINLMEKRVYISNRIEKLQKQMDCLKELMMNAEDMKGAKNEVEKQNIVKKMVEKHGSLGGVGGEVGALDFVGKGKIVGSNDIIKMKKEQENIERLLEEV